MSVSDKSMKIVYGPVHPVVEKQEIIRIPSEKAGEKKIIKHIDLQKELESFLEIQAESHYKHMGKDKVMRRLTQDEKILTEEPVQQSREEGGNQPSR